MRLRLATLLLVTATPVFAADLAASSRIAAVTLYPDGATVTRSVAFDTPAGETTLIARDFPLGLDPSSIRLTGQGDGAVSIGSVEARVVYLDAPGPDAAQDKALQDLRDQRAAVEGEVSALTVKKGFIERIAASGDLFGGDKAALDPAVLRATWTSVGEDLAAVNELIRKGQVRLRELDEAIARQEAERDGRGTGEQRMEVRIALSAAQPVKGALSVCYRVGSARWSPLYDARLDTAAGKLEIVRRAEVSQETGEDWTDAALTISTARATAGAAAPILSTTLVSFYEPQPLASRAAKSEAPAAADAMQYAVPESAPTPEPVMANEQGAVLDTGGFQSVWTLPGAVTLASGPATRALRLDSWTVSPRIVARAAPSIDPTAYLEAGFVHEADTPLFPGRTAIYRDGLYAGLATLPMARKGETVRLGFGADDRIKIERIALRREESETGLVSTTKNDRREFLVKIRNARTNPVAVSIEEGVPVSENEQIKVEMTAGTTPPTLKDADGRRGIMVWSRDVAAGAEDEIRFGYTVSWPADRPINLGP
jgi:uncharacterized protein (TIGR02231 family)